MDLRSPYKIARREVKGVDFEILYNYGIPFHPKETHRSFGEEALKETVDIFDVIENIFYM